MYVHVLFNIRLDSTLKFISSIYFVQSELMFQIEVIVSVSMFDVLALLSYCFLNQSLKIHNFPKQCLSALKILKNLKVLTTLIDLSQKTKNLQERI